MEFLTKHLATIAAVVALGMISVGGVALGAHDSVDLPAVSDHADGVAEDARPQDNPPEHAGVADDVRPDEAGPPDHAGPPENVPPAHANAPGQGHGAAVSDVARNNNPSRTEISGCEFGREVAKMASQERSEEDPEREDCPDEE